jgi:hypothetical protein
MERPGRWLKVAFGTGAVTEAFVLVPMLMPPMARLLWGIDTSARPPLQGVGVGVQLGTDLLRGPRRDSPHPRQRYQQDDEAGDREAPALLPPARERAQQRQ